MMLPRLIFLLPFALRCGAYEYTAKGTFTVEITHLSKRHPMAAGGIKGYFSVHVNDCKWLIRSTRSDEKIDYNQDGYDGKLIYSLSSLESFVRDQRARGVPVAENVAQALVVPGPVPHMESEINRVLWLMLASGCYFSSVNGDLIEPIVTHSSGKAFFYDFKQRATWTLVKGAPSLPMFVAYYDDGEVRKWEDEDSGYLRGPPLKRKWMSPFDQGFTNAIFQVESMSEAPLSQYTRSATFNVFGPNKTSSLELIRSFHVVVTNITQNCEVTDFQGPIPGITMCVDRRFARESPPLFNVIYNFDHSWLTDEAVTRLPNFPQAGAYQLLHARTSSKPVAVHPIGPARLLFWISITALLVVGAVVLKLQKSSSKTDNTKII